MQIAVFGLGYVGFTAACCLAKEGHAVLGIDSNPEKVAAINAGQAPIAEPGVDALLAEGLSSGRIAVDSSAAANGLRDIDLALVCVGTPSGPDGALDLRYVTGVTYDIAEAVRSSNRRERPLTVAYRSTMRPGTMEHLIEPIFEGVLGVDRLDDVHLAYHPEFLREGSAIADYFEPPKVVVGTRDGRENPLLAQLNSERRAPKFHVSYRTAELTKFIDNSWHGTKVAFANEIGRICLQLGIDARDVHEMFVADRKLNISSAYLRPGSPFGGSCLPKDLRALRHLGAELGVEIPLLDSVLASNEAHKDRLFDYAVEGLAPGDRVLLAGLAFKSGTDDLRESPNVDLARRLLDAGYALDVFDPAIRPTEPAGGERDRDQAHPPTFERLLVSKAVAEARHYARVIAATASAAELVFTAEQDRRDIAVLA